MKNLNKIILILTVNNSIKNPLKVHNLKILQKKKDLLSNINRKFRNIKKRVTKNQKICKKKIK